LPKCRIRAFLQLFASLPNLRGAVWVDLGAGTGYNLELMDEAGKLDGFKKIYLVDLSGSLLKQAAERVQKHGWTNVEIVEADATTWVPPNGEEVDLVTFRYCPLCIFILFYYWK
jgi:ubiquinone/menaquinone biosynthesis C-methylase UbiE